MENYQLIRQEHLNHHGSLFGGQLLAWVDECAWMAATREFPLSSFVTRAMDRIEFKHQVKNGSILRFSAERVKLGNSSVTYLVEVFDERITDMNDILAFSTSVTFVSIDDKGQKKNIQYANN